jgi:glycosyltransferase involved in cell wall biosynthesis
MGNRLRIAIYAQLVPSASTGGVESVVIGLLRAIGQHLTDGDEEYVVIGPQKDHEWLRPFIGANQKLIPARPVRGHTVKKLIHLYLKSTERYLGAGASPWPELPVSDGFYESLNCDVIHFPYQKYVLCAMPSIFNPHDLQQLHFPRFFKPEAIAQRDGIMRGACNYANTIVTASEWVKQDIIRHYQIHADKIQVIPWAPPTEVAPAPTEALLSEVRRKYDIKPEYCFYPAVTWAHKNHLRLLEAVVLLRDKHDLTLNLVCTGGQEEPMWSRIQEYIEKNNLKSQVQFLGFVPREELRALYRMSRFLVVPTLFEASSGPIYEAWQDNTAVVCSNVTSLPDQVQDAGLVFDPYSVERMAEAMRRIATNPDERNVLVMRGQKRLQEFSWQRTARAYRAVYRRAADRPLNEEDKELLAWDWMRFPDKFRKDKRNNQ